MSDDPQRIRILCVDDHPIVRQGIAGLLAAEPDMALVAEAANGREAIQQFRAHRPVLTQAPSDLDHPGTRVGRCAQAHAHPTSGSPVASGQSHIRFQF